MNIDKAWLRQHWNHIAAAVLVLVYIVIWLPERMVQQVYHGDREKSIASGNNYAKLVDDNRKTIVQTIGGLLLLGTFYIGLRQLEITRETQITDRFTKAVGYLGANDSRGNKQLETRLGGIYALERIAKDSAYDHWPIMEILTAYVRENAPWRQLELSETGSNDNNIPQPDTDIQAIMTVIGRRNSEQDKGRLNLSRVNLQQIALNKAHLERVILVGAHLEGATLFEVHLEGATLFATVLEGATLQNAHLEGARLDGAHLEVAILSGAHLEGATLSRAHLESATLSGAHLEGANLSGAHLEGAWLEEAHLEGAWLGEAHLEGADLSGARSLTQEQLKATLGDHRTKLPAGLEHPRHWPKYPSGQNSSPDPG